MVVLADCELGVHHGFIFIADDTPPDLLESRGGQVNGLCGAAVPGGVSLVTGLHTGKVPIVVEWYESAPELDPAWPEAVEVSFLVEVDQLRVTAFDDGFGIVLPATGSHRVRYCAAGMDEAHDGTRITGEPALDRYLVQFWPAPPGPDVVLRQSSQVAAYWHGVARETPVPPARPSPSELRRQREEETLERRRRARERVRWSPWGGHEPSEALLAAGTLAPQLARLDARLAEALVVLPAVQQRTIAIWCARRACAKAAGPAVARAVAALDAVERGEAVPEPFGDPQQAWAALFPGPKAMVVRSGVEASLPVRPDPVVAALGAVLAAVSEDPATAVIGAVTSVGGTEADHALYFNELREVFAADPLTR